MPSIREVTRADGQKRYRFVIDVSSKGRRDQKTYTFITREAADAALAELLAARERWRGSEGFPVADLFANKLCHPMCLHSWGTEEDRCGCACQGRYHGRLSDLRTTWAELEAAPVTAKAGKTPLSRRRPVKPELLKKVLALHVEALADPYWKYAPARYAVDELAKQGVQVTMAQVNNWVHHEREKARGGRRRQPRAYWAPPTLELT